MWVWRLNEDSDSSGSRRAGAIVGSRLWDHRNNDDRTRQVSTGGGVRYLRAAAGIKTITETAHFGKKCCAFWRNVTYKENVVKQIDLPFGMVSGVGPGNRVLNEHARWGHLSNTVKQ